MRAELTGALPLGAAGVSVGEDGQAQQAAVWGRGAEATEGGRVVEEQLAVEADQLGTLIDPVGVGGLGRAHRHTHTHTEIYAYVHTHTHRHKHVRTHRHGHAK